MPILPQSKQPVLNTTRLVVTGPSAVAQLFADSSIRTALNAALDASATVSGQSNNVQCIDTNGNSALSITSGWQGTINVNAAWEGSDLTNPQVFHLNSGGTLILSLPAAGGVTELLTGDAAAKNAVAEIRDSSITLGQGATPATWSSTLQVLPALVTSQP